MFTRKAPMPTLSPPTDSYPGLAIVEVLENMGGNRALLRKLAQLFLEQHADDLTLIAAALRAQDKMKAQSLTHALRGTAGNLGALRLSETARDLEITLGSKDALPVTVPAAMQAAMAELVPSLERLAAGF